jgi:hypothetical protein
VPPKPPPGGHQDDGYWRSLRASLIATDDLLTLAVARQGPEPSWVTCGLNGGTRGGLTAGEVALLGHLLAVAAEACSVELGEVVPIKRR